MRPRASRRRKSSRLVIERDDKGFFSYYEAQYKTRALGPFVMLVVSAP